MARFICQNDVWKSIGDFLACHSLNACVVAGSCGACKETLLHMRDTALHAHALDLSNTRKLYRKLPRLDEAARIDRRNVAYIVASSISGESMSRASVVASSPTSRLIKFLSATRFCRDGAPLALRASIRGKKKDGADDAAVTAGMPTNSFAAAIHTYSEQKEKPKKVPTVILSDNFRQWVKDTVTASFEGQEIPAKLTNALTSV